MSTRATIACKQQDGRYAAIYLHFDGYQDHAGRVLKEHYTSIESARTLVAGGDICSLANDGTPERFTEGNRTVGGHNSEGFAQQISAMYRKRTDVGSFGSIPSVVNSEGTEVASLPDLSMQNGRTTTHNPLTKLAT